MHSAEKLLARDKKHKKKGCHLIPLVYSCYCDFCVCVCERERERASHTENKVRDEQQARNKHFKAYAKYLINTAKVCVSAYFFFVCFRLKSYSQVMRNTEKKHVVSSLWYTA